MSTPDPASTARHLARAVAAAEEHVAESGWDQPTRLFALVDNDDLLRREPGLAATLGVPAVGITPVEQEGFDVSDGLDQALARVAWPPEVSGCAVVHEALVLPPGADDGAPEGDEEAVAAWAAAQPGRRDVRLAVGVLRDGERASLLRVRPAGGAAPDAPAPAAEGDVPEDELLTGPDLAPNLADALSATLD